MDNKKKREQEKAQKASTLEARLKSFQTFSSICRFPRCDRECRPVWPRAGPAIRGCKEREEREERSGAFGACGDFSSEDEDDAGRSSRTTASAG